MAVKGPASKKLLAWLPFVAVWAPVFGLSAVFKAQRLVTVPDISLTVAVIEAFRTEILLGVGVVVATRMVADWRQAIPAAGLMGTLQVVAVFYLVLEVLAQRLYVVTGTFATPALLDYMVTNLFGLQAFLIPEISNTPWQMVGVFAALVVLVPLLTSGVRRRIGFEFPGGWRYRVRGLALSMLLILAAMAPSPAPVGIVPSQNAVAGLAWRWVRDNEPDMGDVRLAHAARYPRSLAAGDGFQAKNIVIVLLESTRADWVNPYNPDSPLTPNFAALATQGVLVEHAYAIVPHTSKALVATLCGYEPNITDEVTETRLGGLPDPCLPTLLSGIGYRSGFFQSATEQFERRRYLVSNMGFDHFQALEQIPVAGNHIANEFAFEDRILLEPAMDWIRTDDSPFLAVYLTGAPHSRYLTIPRLEQLRLVDDDRYNRYLNSVHYVDWFVGQLIDQYRQAGLDQDTLFVIMGDHGEAFHEHGKWGHGWSIHDESLRVPLLILAPGSAAAARSVPGPVSQLDIAPTVTSLLGLVPIGGAWRGSPVGQARRDRPIFSHCLQAAECASVISWPFKYLYDYDYYPPSVFNLETDPGETVNIVDQRPEAEQWFRDILAWKRLVRLRYEVSRRDRPGKSGVVAEFEQYHSEVIRDDLSPTAQARQIQLSPDVSVAGISLSKATVKPRDRINLDIFFQTRQQPAANQDLIIGLQAGPGQPIQSVDSFFPGKERYVNAKIHEQRPDTVGGIIFPPVLWPAGKIVKQRFNLLMPDALDPAGPLVHIGLISTDRQPEPGDWQLLLQIPRLD